MISKNPPILKSLLVLLLVALGCIISLVVVADVMCRSDIEQRLPIYPGGEVLETDYDFLRPRAIGVTRMTVYTADDPETVREWYRQHTLELLRNDQFRGQATVDRRIEPDPDSEGTLIYLYSDCAR